jgi:hypothetical protein
MGWWEIDPHTGFAEDTAEKGMHGAIEKSTIIGKYTLPVSTRIRLFSQKVACVLAVVGGGVVTEAGQSLVAFGNPTGAGLIAIGSILEGYGIAGCGGQIHLPGKRLTPFPKPVHKPRRPPFRPPVGGGSIPKGAKVINPRNPRLGNRPVFRGTSGHKNRLP